MISFRRPSSLRDWGLPMVLAVILLSSVMRVEGHAYSTQFEQCEIAAGVRCELITTTEGSGDGARHRLRVIALWRFDNGCDSCVQTDTAARRALREHDRVADSVANTFGWRRLRVGACTRCEMWMRAGEDGRGDSIRVDGLTMFVPEISDEATVFSVTRDLSPSGGGATGFTAGISASVDDAFWLRPTRETRNTVRGWNAYQTQRMEILRRALSADFSLRRFLARADRASAQRR